MCGRRYIPNMSRLVHTRSHPTCSSSVGIPPTPSKRWTLCPLPLDLGGAVVTSDTRSGKARRLLCEHHSHGTLALCLLLLRVQSAQSPSHMLSSHAGVLVKSPAGLSHPSQAPNKSMKKLPDDFNLQAIRVLPAEIPDITQQEQDITTVLHLVS